MPQEGTGGQEGLGDTAVTPAVTALGWELLSVGSGNIKNGMSEQLQRVTSITVTKETSLNI